MGCNPNNIGRINLDLLSRAPATIAGPPDGKKQPIFVPSGFLANPRHGRVANAGLADARLLFPHLYP